MNTAYLERRFVPLDKAKVSILDRGFLYGDGLFETMRSYDGVVFQLEKHVKRLSRSLKILGMRIKIDDRVVYRLLNRNRLKDAYIKIIVTRGQSDGLLIPSGKIRPTLAIYALPYRPLPNKIYEKGIKVNLSSATSNEESTVSRNKTLNYLPNILSRYDAKRKGFDDTIFINTKGFISEASSSNIFLVKGKKIYTPHPESGILLGITREGVIRLAERFLKNKVSERFIRRSALYNADEIFLTNSLAEIVPVTRVETCVVGGRRPGPVTRKVTELYESSVRQYCDCKKNDAK